MNTLYFDARMTDDERRAELYRGQAFVYSPTPSSRAFCAFAREHPTGRVVVVAPRLFTRITPDPAALPLGHAAWEDTRVIVFEGVEACRLENVFTGELLTRTGTDAGLRLGEILADFPVALLHEVRQ